MVGYESGPSLSAGIEGEASRSPRLKDFVYRYYMENYFPTGAETVNFFALGMRKRKLFKFVHFLV